MCRPLNLTKLTDVRRPFPGRESKEADQGLFRTFNLGIILGVALAASITYFYPLVDQHRERSLIAVHANGGNSESFHIRLPDDRIMAGISGRQQSTPPGLGWPEIEFLQNIQTELFMIRNENGVVVGTASRMSGKSEQHGPFVEWAMHLPARGTMYVSMEPTPSPDGFREGSLTSGTREFLTLNGVVLERFIKDDIGPNPDGAGRIELAAALIGPAEEVE
jgi:hypothetical protein